MSCDDSRDMVRMETLIENVEIGECRFDPVVLASSGVDTCVAVVVVLHGGGVVMAHVDATEIWVKVASMEIAAQIFVESCVKMLFKKKPGPGQRILVYELVRFLYDSVGSK